MAESTDDDEADWGNLEELEEMELRILAEKIVEMLRRDLLFEQERRGLDERWGGWRQD